MFYLHNFFNVFVHVPLKVQHSTECITTLDNLINHCVVLVLGISYFLLMTQRPQSKTITHFKSGQKLTQNNYIFTKFISNTEIYLLLAISKRLH